MTAVMPPGGSGDAYGRGRVGAALAIGSLLLVGVVGAAIVAVVRDDDPALRVFGIVNLVVGALVLLAGLVAFAIIAAVSSGNASPRNRLRALSIGGGLVFVPAALLIVLFTMLEFAVSWRGALLSLPTTFLALWTFRRMQRNRKTPWRLVILAFVWGAVVASYYTGVVEGIIHVVIREEMLPGTATIIGHAAAAAFPEEFVKGAGILVLVLLARRRVSGMLSGIVIGACVGVGFQFAESLSYMIQGMDTILYQHWNRQVLGLLVSHATFSGIVGAGLGLATQVTGRWRRTACAASGFLVAVAAHLVWDICSMGRFYWESDDATTQLFVIQPLNLLVLKGPTFALLLVLVVLALRAETRALHRQLLAESANRLGAVTPDEVMLLLDPLRRFRMRLHARWRESRTAYRHLKHLHAAQLDLAFTRWHRELGIDHPHWAEERLRQKIYRLKAEAASVPPKPGAPRELVGAVG